MAQLLTRKITDANRPPDVPDDAVEEVTAFTDANGEPADQADALTVSITYYNADGSPVYSLEGFLPDGA